MTIKTDPDMLATMGMYTIAGEEFLAHVGVRGMRWGVRKAEPPAALRRPSAPAVDHTERNRRIAKIAIGVGVVAVTAIVLKRGGINLTSPASKKIALSGAKTTLKIIQKSGRLMASTSVKIGTVAGKGAGKAGSLVGKGAYKGSIAAGKATARVTAQNGTKFYERVLKKSALSSVRLGSHAMFKMTGRGTPIVKEITKGSMFVNPVDILLNVRADARLGGKR